MITIVGEAPSKSSDPSRPFSGWSGDKLAEYCGFADRDELALHSRLVNVLSRWPGPGYAGEKGSKFPIKRARREAKKIELIGTVILAGRRVASAFGGDLKDVPFFQWHCVGRFFRDGVVAVIPHPSGCNRFYNAPANRAQATKFLTRAFRAEPAIYARALVGRLPGIEC